MHVELFDGAEAKELEHREHRIRRKLQKQGKSREIPKRKWRAKNRRRETCERIGREIREMAERTDAKAVFVGNLRAPRPKKFGALSRRLNNYPFGRLKETIKRHLEKAGIFVKEIYEGKTKKHELGTSQECHKCGSKGERWKGGFSCPSCGLKDYNADLNAAINIGERGAKSLGMPGGLGAVP